MCLASRSSWSGTARNRIPDGIHFEVRSQSEVLRFDETCLVAMHGSLMPPWGVSGARSFLRPSVGMIVCYPVFAGPWEMEKATNLAPVLHVRRQMRLSCQMLYF